MPHSIMVLLFATSLDKPIWQLCHKSAGFKMCCLNWLTLFQVPMRRGTKDEEWHKCVMNVTLAPLWVFHLILRHALTWQPLVHLHQAACVYSILYMTWGTWLSLQSINTNTHVAQNDAVYHKGWTLENMLTLTLSDTPTHARSHTHTHSWHCVLIILSIWLWYNVVKFCVSHCWSWRR